MSGKPRPPATDEHIALALREPTKRARIVALASRGYGPSAIARGLGISPHSVRWHLKAHALGSISLEDERIPERAEYLADAAVRTGFELQEVARILRWHGVKVHRLHRRPYPRLWAWRRDVDKAVAAWLDAETTAAAARRLGLNSKLLRKWLSEAGHKRPRGRRWWRLPSDVIDGVVNARKHEGDSGGQR